MTKKIISVYLFLLISFCQVFSQKSNYLFYQLTTDNGLSNNSITCIYKDSRGFLWIGTIDGLNRYDGYNFVIYKHESSDSNSISDNFISTIIEDPDGNLWIGTQGGGLNKYDPRYERFQAYYHQPNNPNSLPSNFIFHHNSMIIDRNSNLWIGTNNGLCKYNLKKNKFETIPLKHGSFRSSDLSDIRTIFQSSDGNLWIGTNNGLVKYQVGKGVIEVFTSNKNNTRYLTNNIITSIAENVKQNELWIGTEEGLNVLNLSNGSIRHYYASKTDLTTLSDNSITSIITDKEENLWIGTKSGGLNKYQVNDKRFYRWQQNPANKNSLSDNYIDNLFFDNTGYLWIGTVNNGVNLLDIKPKNFIHIKNEPNQLNTLSANTIRSIYKDNQGILWIGTYGGGLNRFDGKNYMHFTHQPDNPNSLSHNIISAIYRDNQSRLWIGTWGGGLCMMNTTNFIIRRIKANIPNFINQIFQDNQQRIWLACNGGIFVYNPDLNVAFRFDSDTISQQMLTANSVNKIIVDRLGNLWVATFDGLNCIALTHDITPVIDTIFKFKKDPRNKNSLSENRIMTLLEDTQGQIWVGTYTGGLNKIVIKWLAPKRITYQINNYTEKDGLAGNIIYGLLSDNKGNIWISTNNGLSRFNLKDEKFQNFSIDDGLQSNQFYWNAYFKDNNGLMYFGGINGLNIFNPDSIRINRSFPQLYLTDFLLYNKSVKVSLSTDKGILSQSISYTNEIVLKRHEYPFTIEFAAILYRSQNKIKYAYKLENFDQDWLITDAKKRYATYSHLRPGKYIFKVKSTNEDGIWNNETRELKITILPAIYETTWAFILYAVILMLLLYFFRSQILARARYKHEIQLQRIERQKLEEYNDMKLRFFTNVSHEFRTPLTLILGPLNKLLSANNIDTSVKEQLQLIQSGSKRLLHLINQLLEFRKVESGNYELKMVEKNVVDFIYEIAHLFKSKAQSNKINYTISFQLKKAEVYFDENVVETITYNLLSNAFKFTPEGGKVTLSIEFLNEKHEKIVSESEIIHYLNIKVSDTGIGIPKEKHEEIFKRFYQLSHLNDATRKGTGIGLTLCKELANIHKGDIHVDSEVGKGAIFEAILAVNRIYFDKQRVVTEQEYAYQSVTEDKLSNHWEEKYIFTDEGHTKLAFKEPTEKNAPFILIVEDDFEIIRFIGKLLESKYFIDYALNGKEGQQKALQLNPDIIISDVMMPEMNGFELCQIIKTDIRLSHIPVILLTALSDIDDKIKGLSYGADEYIPKPFDERLLLVRIEKLIEQRKQLMRYFQTQFQVLPDNSSISAIDEQLLNKVTELIEKNISDPELSVEELSKEVGMSATHLYRKLKSLTGLSTNELIRKIRLKKAATMLLSQKANISQVMIDVGFTSSSYFAKRFQEEFGMTPKEYIQKHSKPEN